MRTKNEEYFKMIEAFIDEHKEKNGVAPTVQEMYPEEDTRVFNFGYIEQIMEGDLYYLDQEE